MKFSIESRAFEKGENETLDWILSEYCYSENGIWYIDIDDLKTLESLIKDIKKSKELIYKDYGWDPNEVIIDFVYNTITLRDSYIE